MRKRVVVIALCIGVLLTCILLTWPSDTRPERSDDTATDKYIQEAQARKMTGKDFLEQHLCFHLAKELTQKEPPTFSNQIFLSNLAYVSGWYKDAYVYAQKSLALASTPEEKVKGLLMQWSCDLTALDTAKAEITLQKVDGFQSELKEYPLLLQYTINKGYHYHNKWHYATALQFYQIAVQINQRKNRADSLLLANTYHKIGNSFNDIFRRKWTHIYTQAPSYDSSRYYYKKAMEINHALLPTVHPRVAITYITLGMMEKVAGNLKEAEVRLKQAFTHLTAGQYNIHPVYTSLALTLLSEIYFDLYKKQNEKKHLDKAYEYASLNNNYLEKELTQYSTSMGRENLLAGIKQLSFVDMATWSSQNYSDGLFPSNTKLLALSVRGKYAATLKQYVGGSTDENPSKDAAKRILDELGLLAFTTQDEGLQKKVDRWQKQDAPTSRSDSVAGQFNDTGQIKRYCKEQNVVVLDYFMAWDKLLIHRFTPYGTSLIVKRFDSSAFTEQMPQRLLRFMLNNQVDSFQHYAYKCYSLLLDGVIAETDQQVVIVPHRFLSQLPWDALVDNPKSGKSWTSLSYQAKKRRFHQAISLQYLLTPNTPAEKSEGLVCFFPAFTGERALPKTGELMKELQSRYDATLYRDSEANFTHLAGLRASVVHLASHTTGNTEKSLLLNQREVIDPLSTNMGSFFANLVVLNACATQQGKYLHGEGHYNLPKLFLGNRCPSVVSSLWNVDEAASAEFFRLFYTHLNRGAATGEAIHLTQKTFMENPLYPDWSNPYYWSPYVLTGKNTSITLR